MAHFGAYACCKLCFRDLYASKTCFPASSTLNIGGGASTVFLKPKNSIFDKKTAIFADFYMKNGKCSCIRMLKMLLSLSICLYNLLSRIQNPQNGGGGFQLACLKPKI